jgi:hypothetical protein
VALTCAVIAALVSQQTVSLSFSGGTAADLSRKVSSVFALPTVTLSDPLTQVKAANLHSESMSGLYELVLSRFGDGSKAAEPIAAVKLISLAPKAWPLPIFYRSLITSDSFHDARPDWKPKEEIVRAPQISVRMETNDFATMQDVRSLLVSDTGAKSVDWHWFFNKFELAINAVETDRRLLATGIARTIGATLRNEDGRMYFDLDVRAMRDRVAALPEHGSAHPLFPIERHKLNAACYSKLTDSQIRDIWKTASSQLVVEVSAENQLRSLVNDYIKYLAESEINPFVTEKATYSIGKKAHLLVTPNGALVGVHQPDGTIIYF